MQSTKAVRQAASLYLAFIYDLQLGQLPLNLFFDRQCFYQPLQHLITMPESKLPSDGYRNSDAPSIQELESHVAGARVRITN